MTSNNAQGLAILVFVFIACILTGLVSGQMPPANGKQIAIFKPGETKNLTAGFLSQPAQISTDTVASATSPLRNFPNPLLLDPTGSCRPDNLNPAKFSNDLDAKARLVLCDAVQRVSVKLHENWSPALRDEIAMIWQVFEREKVVIRPMKKGISSNVVAAAEAFTDNRPGAGFNASFYLRPERAGDKSFLLVFMHEMRHIYDFYALWKNHSNMTEAELEMRGFRMMGRIYQEIPDKPYLFRMPTFWENDWKNLTAGEIEIRREAKIARFMRGNGFYKSMMKNPGQHTVGYLTAAPLERISPEARDRQGEKLPVRLKINQTKTELPQMVRELSFALAKGSVSTNSDELLRAALINEKNLYYKMTNFVYEQNLQLQCWKKEQVTESYLLNDQITRAENGQLLIQNKPAAAINKVPTCVLNMELIKSDAAETFWAAPYLEMMNLKFDSYDQIAGVRVAKYTVYQPTPEKFNQMAARYPQIKNFRAFVGTIYVSIEDAQIIRFWGTSFSGADATGYQSQHAFGSYCATAIRQKLSSGVWVTSLLNTVAVTTEKDKMKPFSYVVKYENYRQGTTDVKILDDDEIISKK